MGCHPRYMLPITHHKVRKDLGLIEVRGRVSILGLRGKCKHLVLLELVYLSQEVVDHVISVCEHDSMVLHLLKFLQFLLQVWDLQVLRGLELLKLTGFNLDVLLCHPQKDTVPE
jgi:hypothetical protein